jgi:uncharacterized protein (DUF427 family)
MNAHPKMPNRIEPGTGQESVWDYPRPPRVEEVQKHVQVTLNGQIIADTRNAKRVLETAGAPVYYIPREDIQMDNISISQGRQTHCEWKGVADYVDVSVGEERVSRAGWYYKYPTPGYESIKDYIAFYAQKMEACYIDGEKVRPQPGYFYGGWVTDDIVGPFKGEPGTEAW